MRNFTIFNIVAVVLIFFQSSQAQIVVTGLGFTQACASPSFNTYNVSFNFQESALGSTNQFIIELSDPTGSFTDATEIYTSNVGEVTTSPATLTFSVPTTTSGESYKLRIRGTDPVALSNNSDTFPAYYRIQDTPFTINNLIDIAEYCAGGSYLLTIDNPGVPPNDSPLQYPSLTFNWFRETGPTTSVLVFTGPTYSVDTPGTYFAETNYGTCTSNSFSNRVTVNEVGAGGISISIDSSLGNPYCSSDGPTTLSTANGNSYQWFKDGIEIENATDQTYITNEAGIYSVNIDLGTCISNATINLDNGENLSSINVDESNTIGEGETLDVIVTTSATNPIFEWYINDTLIPGETEDNYEVTGPGNYKVVVNQLGGCSSELVFTVIELFPSVAEIPNLVSPNGDGNNDSWIIPQEYVSGTNTDITIISSQGEIVFKTNNYLNNWPIEGIDFKNVNPVYYYIIETEDQDILKGSITVIK